MRPTPPRGRGFTLIELMVVLALVGILLSLLLPAVFASRTAANSLRCANNMRQIGLAITMFCEDNQGRFPESTHTAGFDFERSWINKLAPYLENVDTVRISPADPRADERLRARATSYVLNEYLCVPGEGAVLRLPQLQEPTRTIVMFPASDSMGLSIFSDHTHSRNWFRPPFPSTWRRIIADIQPDRFGANARPSTHDPKLSGWAHYLYADGRVEQYQAQFMKEKADRQENFARPPQ